MSAEDRLCDACGASLVVDGELRFDLMRWGGKNRVVCHGGCSR